MTGLFSWIRQKVKAAVLGGINDALEEIGGKADPVVVPELRYEPEAKAKASNGKAVARG